MIVTSADKLTRRGQKIEALEFEAGPKSETVAETPKAVESRTGLLKLRVVDED